MCGIGARPAAGDGHARNTVLPDGERRMVGVTRDVGARVSPVKVSHRSFNLTPAATAGDRERDAEAYGIAP